MDVPRFGPSDNDRLVLSFQAGVVWCGGTWWWWCPSASAALSLVVDIAGLEDALVEASFSASGAFCRRCHCSVARGKKGGWNGLLCPAVLVEAVHIKSRVFNSPIDRRPDNEHSYLLQLKKAH